MTEEQEARAAFARVDGVLARSGRVTVAGEAIDLGPVCGTAVTRGVHGAFYLRGAWYRGLGVVVQGWYCADPATSALQGPFESPDTCFAFQARGGGGTVVPFPVGGRHGST